MKEPGFWGMFDNYAEANSYLNTDCPDEQGCFNKCPCQFVGTWQENKKTWYCVAFTTTCC